MDSPPPPPLETPKEPYHDLSRPPSTTSILEFLLSPHPITFLITGLCIILLPLLGHYIFFRPRVRASPTFVLLGPRSAGKTALLTSFASSPTDTRTSQAPLTLPASIPSTLAASSKYRSTNDPTLGARHTFLLRDTPGHGKLRNDALATLDEPGVVGAVFVVDASAPAGELPETAEYLHAVLLELQRLMGQKSRKEVFRVAVACNKADLFTALPAGSMKKVLEEEVGKVREVKSRGVVGVGEEEKEDLDEWLGDVGSEKFEFEQLAEAGIEVEFLSGSVKDDGWREKLGEWFGKSL